MHIHHYQYTRDFMDFEWDFIITAFNKILSGYAELLFFDIKKDVISFSDIKDITSQLFLIERHPTKNFYCIKSENAEYDIVICLTLISIEKLAPNILKISNDGISNWKKAEKIYEKLFPDKNLTLFVPISSDLYF